MNRKFIRTVGLMGAIAALGFLFSCGTHNKKAGEADVGNTKVHEQTITVFAAASLTDVLSEIVDSFEVKFNNAVKINTASSGTLARQIEQGGNPDLYISASKNWADYVDSLGYILGGYKAEIVQNELVLIIPKHSKLELPVIDSSLDFLALLGKGRLSIGDPLHVPAGKYARQSLEYFGWYKQLENRMLPAKDVRSALMVVELEEVPAGIVYRTDALKSNKVRILGVFPERTHNPIVYVVGVCKDNKLAKEFFTYLNSGEIKPIWTKYGFKK